jgi:hypothetical protein
MKCRLLRDKTGLFQTFHLEVELENDEKPVFIILLMLFLHRKIHCYI